VLSLGSAEAGDVVYLPAGYSNAVVLHPRPDEMFMFIGDRFVMGIDNLGSRDLDLQKITLV
jgi:hypothetical protein